MRVRVNYHPYQDAVKRYFDFLLPKLAPLQWSKNGPIIAFQVENEYGDYVKELNIFKINSFTPIVFYDFY
jgi:beta-galactosidase GanA